VNKITCEQALFLHDPLTAIIFLAFESLSQHSKCAVPENIQKGFFKGLHLESICYKLKSFCCKSKLEEIFQLSVFTFLNMFSDSDFQALSYSALSHSGREGTRETLGTRLPLYMEPLIGTTSLLCSETASLSSNEVKGGCVDSTSVCIESTLDLYGIDFDLYRNYRTLKLTFWVRYTGRMGAFSARKLLIGLCRLSDLSNDLSL